MLIYKSQDRDPHNTSCHIPIQAILPSKNENTRQYGCMNINKNVCRLSISTIMSLQHLLCGNRVLKESKSNDLYFSNSHVLIQCSTLNSPEEQSTKTGCRRVQLERGGRGETRSQREKERKEGWDSSQLPRVEDCLQAQVMLHVWVYVCQQSVQMPHLFIQKTWQWNTQSLEIKRATGMTLGVSMRMDLWSVLCVCVCVYRGCAVPLGHWPH